MTATLACADRSRQTDTPATMTDISRSARMLALIGRDRLRVWWSEP